MSDDDGAPSDARRRRFLRGAVAVCGLALGAGRAHAQGTPDAQGVIEASDRVRNPGVPFSVRNTLIEYRSGVENDSMAFLVMAKESPETRQFLNVLRYIEPPRDRGKIILSNGKSMWFYDPASKSSVRISPQERLFGQAANGDVIIVNFARDYNARSIVSDTVNDAQKTRRDCWKIDMVAANEAATYARVEYWVEKTTDYPVKSRCYADSGRLLKVAFYRRFQEEMGRIRPTEVVIVDAVNSNLVTIMHFSDYRARKLPDEWFQREYLPRLRSD